jgi:hypothetical protein
MARRMSSCDDALLIGGNASASRQRHLPEETADQKTTPFLNVVFKNDYFPSPNLSNFYLKIRGKFVIYKNLKTKKSSISLTKNEKLFLFLYRHLCRLTMLYTFFKSTSDRRHKMKQNALYGKIRVVMNTQMVYQRFAQTKRH